MTGKIMPLHARLFCSFALLCAIFLFAPKSFAQSFTVTASPSALTIHPGDEQIPVTVSVASSTYAGPVYVSLTGLPSGITATPIMVTPGSTGTIYLNASLAADQEAFPAATSGDPNTATSTISVTGVAGTAQAAAAISLTVSLTNPSFAPEASNITLPIVSIDTSGVAVTSKTTLVSGTIAITSADKQKTYLPNSSDSDNTLTIHVHGNSTASEPKLPYEIKLGTSVDLLTAMGMSCPYVTGSGKAICDKSKTYVLLANYDDKTMLRDWAASALANAIPMGGDYLTSPADSPTPSGTTTLMPWAPHSYFVELYLNGAYEGVYQLIEKVNVDSHRINITELTDTDTSGDLSGGYQMEIDHEQGEDYNFIAPQDVYIGMNDPDFTPEIPEQEEYITNYIDTASDVLFGSGYTDPTQGWRAYFDEASAVNFYFVNDLIGNVDGGAFYSSDYFYKAADNPLLYMGAVWDFDISSGNSEWSAITLPSATWMISTPWYNRFFSDPGFLADAATQWNALVKNGVLSSWLESVETQSQALEQPVKNNFGRWPMLGIRVWPNTSVAGSYDGEVNAMITWIKFRMGYMDSFLNNRPTTTTSLSLPSGTLRTGTAVTLNAQVSGASGSNFSGSVAFYANNSTNFYGSLGTATVGSDGQASASVTLPAGTDSVDAIYSGDSTHAMSVSSASTMTVLTALSPTTTTLSASGAGTVTAVVASSSDLSTKTPTGTVTLLLNGAAVSSATVTATGTAQLTIPSTSSSGSETTLQASYSGDGNFSASTSNIITGIQTATPVFSLAAGTYHTVQTVSITDATSGASIYYTTDGTTPTIASTLYTGPITLQQVTNLQAIAIASGDTVSPVTATTYNVLIPNFSLSLVNDVVTMQNSQAAFQLTVTPESEFNGAISFSCSGLTAGYSCSFSPASVTPGTTTMTVSGKVSATGSQSASSTPVGQWLGRYAAGSALAMLIWPVRRRRAWFTMVLFVLLGAGAAVSLTGCSSPTTMIATITASGTADGTSITQTVTLHVQ